MTKQEAFEQTLAKIIKVTPAQLKERLAAAKKSSSRVPAASSKRPVST